MTRHYNRYYRSVLWTETETGCTSHAKDENVRRELLRYVGLGMTIQRACSQQPVELCGGEIFSGKRRYLRS